MRERKGYVLYDLKRKDWIARTSVTDDNGKRRFVERRAKSKTEAEAKLKTLIRQIDDEGSKVVDFNLLTFSYLRRLFLSYPYPVHQKTLSPSCFADNELIKSRGVSPSWSRISETTRATQREDKSATSWNVCDSDPGRARPSNVLSLTTEVNREAVDVNREAGEKIEQQRPSPKLKEGRCCCCGRSTGAGASASQEADVITTGVPTRNRPQS
jgi:hypothetical protein